MLRATSLAVLLLGLAGCASSGVQPAAGRHFAPGMWDVSATGSASLHRIDNELVDRAVSVECTPQCGYFVTDRLEVLASAGVEHSKVEYEDRGAPLQLEESRSVNYSAALGLQYNWDNESKVVPFARLFGGVLDSHRKTIQTNIPFVGTAKDEETDTAPYYGVRLGIRYFTAANISIDAGLGWKRILYDDDFGDDTDDYSLVFGCAFFF